MFNGTDGQGNETGMGRIDIFKLLKMEERGENKRTGFSVCLNSKVSELDFNFPLTRVCYSEEQLIKEVGFIHENLNKIVEDARNRFNEDGFVGKFIISPDMKPGDIWSALEKIEDQDFFIEQFNILEEEIRKAVAEHVLTQCNVFSGKGATFSARYNEQTKCME